MKQANRNSVDLLLRSLARGQQESRSDGKTENELVSEHLDADELNLYAEGVLAPPARVRYTEHLADCSICRKLVVELAQSAGRTVRHETTSQQSGAGFWQSLAALFALPVLRYALPAILLTGLLAIGLLALREQRRSELVAVNQQAEPSPAYNQTSPDSGNAVATASRSDVAPKPATHATPSTPSVNDPAGSTGLFSQKPASPADSGSTDASAVKAAPESPQVAGVVTSQPSYAPEPPPPPKLSSEAATKSMTRKEDAPEREAAKRNQDEVTRLSKDESPTHGPARSRAAVASGGRRDADVAAENRAASAQDKKEAAEDTEARTVSGRRFRRQGNAWVDTAYQSSRGATNVGRGSEQFRALMADEPGLRAIAQQLGGEVVVVWKNRAYRFR